MQGRPNIKKSDFDEKVLDIKRVTRVVAGGKRFRFRATIVLGNRKGSVGVGVAKGADVAESIAKARNNARKNLIMINLRDARTIAHEVEAKFRSARIKLKPAVSGHGLIAGGSVRAVVALAGIKDITAKCLGRTTNKLTNAMATIEALKNIKTEK